MSFLDMKENLAINKNTIITNSSKMDSLKAEIKEIKKHLKIVLFKIEKK